MRRTVKLETYDLTLEKTAVLQNAYNIIVDDPLNSVGSLTFTLPGDDHKIAYCSEFHFVRSPDGVFYRILKDGIKRGNTGEYTIFCEHGIATLVDQLVAFQDYQIGGRDFRTAAVIDDILGKQIVRRWQLGSCDFARMFEYAWSSENALEALFSVPRSFAEDYKWTYDFQTHPWTIHLLHVDPDEDARFYINAGRNLISEDGERTMEQLCTRLYLLGYGEGDNQLTIREVNDGVPYLQSPQAYVDRYGVIEKVFSDMRFELADSLKSRGEAILKAVQEPQYRRSFSVADLYDITGNEIDNARVGDKAKLMMDGTFAHITRTRRNLSVDSDLTIEMSTIYADVAATISDFADRQRISEVYANGATQLTNFSSAENGDAETPVIVKLYIPSEMIIVNKVRASISMERGRSYSRVTRGGGGSTQASDGGGGGATTSQAAGQSTQTSSASGQEQITSGPSSRYTTAQNLGATMTNSVSLTQVAGGGRTGSTSIGTSYLFQNTSRDDGSVGMHSHDMGHSHAAQSHTHTGDAHQHSFAHVHQMPHAHDMDHTHTVMTPSHRHTVEVPAHTHTVNMPSHTHGVAIPEHAHEIQPGIYRSGNPTSAVIQVNGVTKDTMSTERELDLTQYLLNDQNKIPRDTWIRLGILPNDFSYIDVAVTIQGFVQSRGGGTY